MFRHRSSLLGHDLYGMRRLRLWTSRPCRRDPDGSLQHGKWLVGDMPSGAACILTLTRHLQEAAV
jgi:hypothetical protein